MLLGYFGRQVISYIDLPFGKFEYQSISNPLAFLRSVFPLMGTCTGAVLTIKWVQNFLIIQYVFEGGRLIILEYVILSCKQITSL